MAKNIYQLPSHSKMKLFHSNIWLSDGIEFLKKCFPYSKGLELYRKDIRSIDNIWNSKQNDFSTWEDIQNKFNLTSTEARDWGKS